MIHAQPACTEHRPSARPTIRAGRAFFETFPDDTATRRRGDAAKDFIRRLWSRVRGRAMCFVGECVLKYASRCRGKQKAGLTVQPIPALHGVFFAFHLRQRVQLVAAPQVRGRVLGQMHDRNGRHYEVELKNPNGKTSRAWLSESVLENVDAECARERLVRDSAERSVSRS